MGYVYLRPTHLHLVAAHVPGDSILSLLQSYSGASIPWGENEATSLSMSLKGIVSLPKIVTDALCEGTNIHEYISHEAPELSIVLHWTLHILSSS